MLIVDSLLLKRCSLAALLLAACTPASPTGSPPPMPTGAVGGSGGGGGGEPCTRYDCSNVVDAVLVPMLVHSDLPVTREADAVLCRRMAIDLTGIAPTVDEQQNECAGKTPGQMADYFMNKTSGVNVPDSGQPASMDLPDGGSAPFVAAPAQGTSPYWMPTTNTSPYVFVNRRWWADSFQYAISSTSNTFWLDAYDLDDLVTQLYAGKLPYDRFVIKALASPAFARRFGIFDKTNHDLVQIASQAYRVFLGREALPSEAIDFGNLWRGWDVYEMYPAESDTLYPAWAAWCARVGNGCETLHMEVGLDGRQCAGARQLSCVTRLFGGGGVVPSTSRFTRWGALSSDDLARLETPGRLMVAQPELADAAVDRALQKYLGWWKAGFYRPDSDLPAVRAALARKLVADGYDVRKLDREIVTSLLYVQAAARAPDQNALDPIWAFGPTKPLYAEAWLDSLAQATGTPLGGCDFRVNNDYSHAFDYPNFMAFSASKQTLGRFFYQQTCSALGGCPLASTHGSPAGLVPAVTRRAALARVCPRAFTPAATLDGLITLEYQALGRAPSADERSRWLTRMSAADAGANPQAAADGLCTSLFDSATFNFY